MLFLCLRGLRLAIHIWSYHTINRNNFICRLNCTFAHNLVPRASTSFRNEVNRNEDRKKITQNKLSLYCDGREKNEWILIVSWLDSLLLLLFIYFVRRSSLEKFHDTFVQLLIYVCRVCVFGTVCVSSKSEQERERERAMDAKRQRGAEGEKEPFYWANEREEENGRNKN